MSYGFWMDNNGNYFSVDEHGSVIVKTPKKFGLDKKQIDLILKDHPYNPQSTEQESGRGLILKLAFQKGFIRIRGSGSAGFSFQFWGKPKRVVDLILEEFGEEYFGPYTFVTLTDLSSDYNWQGSYQDLKEAHMNGDFDHVSSAPKKDGKTVYRGSDQEVRQQLRKNLVPAGAIFGESLRKKINKILFG
jgi:hypothetical protein